MDKAEKVWGDLIGTGGKSLDDIGRDNFGRDFVIRNVPFYGKLYGFLFRRDTK